MSGGLPEMRCKVPSPSSVVEFVDLLGGALVEPGRALAQGPVVAVELREGLALVGNGKAGDAG